MAESLAAHTTFRIGGPAGTWVVPASEAELIDVVARADEAGEPLLILGGGSNVLISDAGFPGTV
ncbi:FAD-binding protein, partial [Staphylococcus epidermidis]|uniref:FAD-binding protein n=1 Tax=Staphylococcus epidermidis TaxID=1282 RepID=UPI0033974D0F